MQINLEQILKHPIILKKLEVFKSFEENEESSLLQTIRIPKNLLFLTDKLPQPNYEKRQNKKNHSFTEENKDSLPEIKMNQKNIIRKRSDKKYDKENKDSDNEERQKEHRLSMPNHLPTQNGVSEDSNIKLNNQQVIPIPKKKRRIENNDRSMDNIISPNIYSSALNGSSNNNIKILKSENYDNNNSILRDKSPYEDSPLLKKKKELMMLPNIRNQQKNENK